MTEERKISDRYRELPREEPPRHVDDAILSAARRAVESRPAPLVVPAGRRRWYFPLAAAAVIVLAVAVTMHVERERPDQEALVVPSDKVLSETRTEEARDVAKAEKATPPAQPVPASPPPARKAAPAQGFTPDPKPQALPESAPASPPPEMRDQQARDFARLDSDRRALERQRLAQERAAQEAAAAKSAPDLMRQQSARRSGALSTFAEQSPEQWLQGIDDLKRQGRHEEAEKQLAEFRKRYPNYRIPEAMLEKFERR